MRIAVLSGKGGTGKTFLSVNLAAAAENAVYIDCDVEEPNGRLFLKPEHVTEKPVNVWLPAFDREKCTGCRACVDFCRFHALVFIREKPKFFSEACHSCGGCSLVCPSGAVKEEPKEIGCIETGWYKNVQVITGILNPGEASGVPVIKKALELGAEQESELTVIDCPPGSACSVMESIGEADYCVLVAEPTAFGFHNFQMVYELASLMKKPCGVVINKFMEPYEPLEQFCRDHDLKILQRIPYSRELAEASADGKAACEDERFRKIFLELLEQIGGVGL